MPEETRLTREELYERIWTEPVRTVAKQFGISDVALAKGCKQLKIPLPGRGYWMKKAAGKSVRRDPLPALPPSDSVTPREKVFQPPPASPSSQPLPAPVAKQKAFEADPLNRIVVRQGLHAPHPLIKQMLDATDAAKSDLGDYRRSGRVQRLDIDVSKGLYKRALRIMDALLKGFDLRGWPVTFGQGDDRKTYVAVLGQQLAFGIREPLKRVLNPPAKLQRLLDGTFYTPWHSKYSDEPSGRLAFITRHSWGHCVDKSWVETKSRPLEERLNDFIISLVSIAHEENEADKRHSEAERARREAEEETQRAEEKRKVELARRRRLLRQSSRWEISQTGQSILERGTNKGSI